MFVICSSIENCVICVTPSLGSCGDEGSWCCIWATKSFRKPSLSSDALGLATLVLPDARTVAALAAFVGCVLMAMKVGGFLSEDVDENAVGEHESRFGRNGRFRKAFVNV